MIVECGNCDTRFQLDESRIPLRGIRVRCSRCKEAFFLRHPDASADDAVHDAASSAVEEESGTTEDLSEVPRARGKDAQDPDEEDWQFNDERRPRDPNEDSIGDFGAIGGIGTDAADAVDFSDGLDPDADGGAEDDGDIDLRAGGGAFDELTTEDGAAEDQAVGRSDLTTFGETADFSSPASEPRGVGAAPAAPRSEGAPEQDASDVGDPDDWDFFTEETLERPYPLDGATGASTAAAAGGREPRTGVDALGPGIVRARRSLDHTRRPVFQVVGSAIGWVATLSLFCVGIVWGALREPAAAFQAPVVVPLGAFRAEDVRGYWLDTARSGSLYVVSGRLANPGDRRAVPAAHLRVALVEASGARLGAEPVDAGVPLAERELRELPPERLAALARSAASRLAWGAIAPRAAGEFQAFFVDLPPEAAGFVLELEPAAPPPPAPPLVADEDPSSDDPAVEPDSSPDPGREPAPEVERDAAGVEPARR